MLSDVSYYHGNEIVDYLIVRSACLSEFTLALNKEERDYASLLNLKDVASFDQDLNCKAYLWYQLSFVYCKMKSNKRGREHYEYLKWKGKQFGLKKISIWNFGFDLNLTIYTSVKCWTISIIGQFFKHYQKSKL